MYVRWQKKKRRTSQAMLGDLLCVTLVESKRVDGKPRQCVIKYLGSVREEALNHEFGKLRIDGFWQSVTAKLDELNLPKEVRKKIESKIEVRIPRPSVTETMSTAPD
jgi:hypothetical protein